MHVAVDDDDEEADAYWWRSDVPWPIVALGILVATGRSYAAEDVPPRRTYLLYDMPLKAAVLTAQFHACNFNT